MVRPKAWAFPVKASRFSSRLRDKEDAEFSKIVTMAKTLKAHRMGDTIAPLTKAPAPLTSLDLKTLAHMCQPDPPNVVALEVTAGALPPTSDARAAPRGLTLSPGAFCGKALPNMLF
jgi:hypothetical protein